MGMGGEIFKNLQSGPPLFGAKESLICWASLKFMT